MDDRAQPQPLSAMATSQDKHLERLPSEIRILVIEHLDCTALRALCRASPVYLQQFLALIPFARAEIIPKEVGLSSMPYALGCYLLMQLPLPPIPAPGNKPGYNSVTRWCQFLSTGHNNFWRDNLDGERFHNTRNLAVEINHAVIRRTLFAGGRFHPVVNNFDLFGIRHFRQSVMEQAIQDFISFAEFSFRHAHAAYHAQKQTFTGQRIGSLNLLESPPSSAEKSRIALAFYRFQYYMLLMTRTYNEERPKLQPDSEALLMHMLTYECGGSSGLEVYSIRTVHTFLRNYFSAVLCALPKPVARDLVLGFVNQLNPPTESKSLLLVLPNIGGEPMHHHTAEKVISTLYRNPLLAYAMLRTAAVNHKIAPDDYYYSNMNKMTESDWWDWSDKLILTVSGILRWVPTKRFYRDVQGPFGWRMLVEEWFFDGDEDEEDNDEDNNQDDDEEDVGVESDAEDYGCELFKNNKLPCKELSQWGFLFWDARRLAKSGGLELIASYFPKPEKENELQ